MPSSSWWRSSADERPVVVIIEDLHWSDASTRNLLMYAMRAVRDVPLLLVGTYRTDDITRRHPLRPFLAEAARLASTDTVELDRLDPVGVAQLLAELLGSRAPAAMVDDVYGRCGGNPFLVEEVTAAGLDRGAGELPRRLHDILLARTAPLSAQAGEVLRVAAVGGPRIDDGLLRRVCLLAPEAVDAALRELLDYHVLEPDADRRGYVFRHALTAEAVYDDALPGERVRLHAAFARAIGDDPNVATAGESLAAVERARHWQRAGHGTDALPAWLEAAAEAERVRAYPEALAAYESALELWPSIDRAETLAGLTEVELLRRAAMAASWAAEPARALSLVESALALVDESGEPGRAAVLLELLGRYSWGSGREADALTYYQRAVELAPAQPPSAERARALAGHAQILMLHWHDREAEQRAQEAIDAAHQSGAVAVEAHASNTLSSALLGQGDEAGALRAMDESARLTERSDDDVNVARLCTNRVYHQFGFGHLEAAVAHAQHGRAVLRDLGLGRGPGAHLATNESLALVDLGRWDEARVLLDGELAQARRAWWPTEALQARAWLNWLTGRIDEAEHDLDEIQRLGQATDVTEGQIIAAQAQAVVPVAIETQHWETAVQTVTDIVRLLPEEEGHPVVHWETMTAVWLGLWAAAELAREREAGAAWLAPHLAELDRLLTAAARRPVDRRPVRYRALLALCEAERARIAGTANADSWRRAVDALDELGAVAQRAYARVRLAEQLLAESAARSDAADALNEAVSLFADAPRSPIRALAEQVAQRARLRLAQLDDAAEPRSQSPFGLTEREVDVLRLLAEARTNREIGEALFISPKTVSVHVSSIMRKLGVRRRADAARIARKTTLDDTTPSNGAASTTVTISPNP